MLKKSARLHALARKIRITRNAEFGPNGSVSVMGIFFLCWGFQIKFRNQSAMLVMVMAVSILMTITSLAALASMAIGTTISRATQRLIT